MSFEIAIHDQENIVWLPPPEFHALADSEVVLWKIDSRISHMAYPLGKSLLGPDEIDHAKRFRQTEDADLFLTSRIALRILAGFYLDKDPKQLRFRKGAFSKPYLVTDFPTLYFNVPHSGNLILIAFCLSEVGIDLEKRNPKFDIYPLLNEVFTKEEKSYICQNSYDSQRRFYLLWTRKECLLKQIGSGLIDGLNVFSVLNGQHTDPQNRLKVQQNLQIISFSVATNYIASLCVNQHVTSARCHDFELGHFIF